MLVTCVYYLLNSNNHRDYIKLLALIGEKSTTLPGLLLSNGYPLCIDTMITSMYEFSSYIQPLEKYDLLHAIVSYLLMPFYEVTHMDMFLDIYLTLSETGLYREFGIKHIISFVQGSSRDEVIVCLSKQSMKQKLQQLIYNASSSTDMDCLLDLIGSIGGPLRDELSVPPSISFLSNPIISTSLTLSFVDYPKEVQYPMDESLDYCVHVLATHLVSYENNTNKKNSSSYVSDKEKDTIVCDLMMKDMKMHCFECIKSCWLQTLSTETESHLSYYDESREHFISTCYYGLLLGYLDRDVHEVSLGVLDSLIRFCFICVIRSSGGDSSFDSDSYALFNNGGFESVFGMDPFSVLSSWRSEKGAMNCLVTALLALLSDGYEDAIHCVTFVFTQFFRLSQDVFKDTFTSFAHLFSFFDMFLNLTIIHSHTGSWRLQYSCCNVIHFLLCSLPAAWTRHNYIKIITFFSNCLSSIPGCCERDRNGILNSLLVVCHHCLASPLPESITVLHVEPQEVNGEWLSRYMTIEDNWLVVFSSSLVKGLLGTSVIEHSVILDLIKFLNQNKGIDTMSGRVIQSVCSDVNEVSSKTCIHELSDVEVITYIKTLDSLSRLGLDITMGSTSQLFMDLLAYGMKHIPDTKHLFMDYLPNEFPLPSSTTHFSFSQDLNREVSTLILSFLYLLVSSQLDFKNEPQFIDYVIRIVGTGNKQLTTLCSSFSFTNKSPFVYTIKSLLYSMISLQQSRVFIQSIEQLQTLSFYMLLFYDDEVASSRVCEFIQHMVDYLLDNPVVVSITILLSYSQTPMK